MFKTILKAIPYRNDIVGDFISIAIIIERKRKCLLLLGIVYITTADATRIEDYDIKRSSKIIYDP